MQKIDDITTWLRHWQPQIKQANERRLVVLEGNEKWQKECICHFANFYTQLGGKTFLWGESLPPLVGTLSNYRHQLGQENDVVFFTDDDFHPDAFAALAGTIKAGGLFIWLPNKYSAPNSRFLARIIDKISDDENVIKITPHFYPSIRIEPSIVAEQLCGKELLYGCVTKDQVLAVDAILKVANGHRKRPLILTADRGRGKSSSLAIAVAQQLTALNDSQSYTILVSAPSPLSLKVFFHQLAVSCPKGTLTEQEFSYLRHRVKYCPADQLIAEQQQCQLLLIDEAAGIPVYLLENIAKRYSRIVYSSTQHGYEGAGRGFAIKFTQQLLNISPNFQSLHLSKPIRWREEDPVEEFVFDSFLFRCYEQIDTFESQNDMSIELIPKETLFADEILLRNVFSVLVTAHYQTSPSDLKMLLDNPAAKVFVQLDIETKVVSAVALVIEEGNACAADVALMQASNRQLKNQFTPQYLLRHCHRLSAFDYSYWRISRIAVKEQIQGKGVGRALLNFIKDQASLQDIDFISTSFGVSEEVIKFWHQNSFNMMKLGVTRDQSSGAFSALMLSALSKKACSEQDELSTQFYRSFSYNLSVALKGFSPRLAIDIFTHCPKSAMLAPQRYDESIVTAYIEGEMQFAQSAFNLHIWFIYHLTQLTNQQRESMLLSSECVTSMKFLMARLVQLHSDKALSQQFNLTGKKQISRLCHASVQCFAKQIAK